MIACEECGKRIVHNEEDIVEVSQLLNIDLADPELIGDPEDEMQGGEFEYEPLYYHGVCFRKLIGKDLFTDKKPLRTGDS